MGRAQGFGVHAADRRAHRQRRRRGPYRWTDEVLASELRTFIGDTRRFPTLNELDAAGRSDLRAAITENGGVQWWAERLGLPVERHRRQGEYSEDDARRDAHAIISECGGLPGEGSIRSLGYNRLATRVRQAGGAAAFMKLHRLGD